jgi:serine/threonine-protein kinase
MAALLRCPDPHRLQGLLDGTLPEAEQAAVSGHLETCTVCQQALEGLVAGRSSWEGAARRLGEPDAAAASACQAAVHAARDEPTATDSAGAAADLPPDFLAPPAKPGQLGKLDHYQILEVVGRGGMGVVLKAFDERLQRVAAIKVLAPQLAADAAARRRFTREARAAAAVSHDHVVAIYAVEPDGRLPYFVMQYIAGVSLQDRLDHSGPPGLAEVLRIAVQTAEGLAAAHKQGLVHRDVKPANILLENGVERVKLTDFGLARAVDDASVSRTGVVAGTPQYMAPEQARGEPVDHRADLFALGGVLYALCTGMPPFRGSSVMATLKRVCEEEPRPVREVNPDVPDWLAAIIAKLHAKNPDNRFQTAAEVADLLGRHLAHLQAPTQAPMPAPVAVPLAPAPSGRLIWMLRILTPAAFVLTGVGAVLTVLAWLDLEIWHVRIPLLLCGAPAIFLFAVITAGLFVAVSRLRRKAGQASSPLPAKIPRLIPPRRRRWRAAIALVLPIAAGVGVVAVVLWSRSWTPDRPPPVDDAWVEAVAAMGSGRQPQVIREKMSELNPGFNGQHMNLTIKDGTEITDVVFPSEEVTDISPLRALRSLHSLECPGLAWVTRGKLADLSPLRGLPLRRLVIHNTEVKDLSPLRDMPLTYLSCYGTEVQDLSPLRGLPLTHLDVGGTHISDLSPLEGMKLTFLHCDHTAVEDLRPLRGMPLQELHCHQTRVSSLWPLKDMPLTDLRCDRPERFVAVVRSLRSLGTLNEGPAAAWKEEHAGIPADASEEDSEALQGSWFPTSTVRALGDRPVHPIPEIVHLVFDGDEIVFVKPGVPPAKAKFTLDAANRAIDFRLGPEDPVSGIYRLEGDTLTLVLGAPGELLALDNPGGNRQTVLYRGGNPRPAGFAEPPDLGEVLLRLTRER